MSKRMSMVGSIYFLITLRQREKAVEEYCIVDEGKVYLSSGSRVTGSNIAFTMGAKGLLLEKAENYNGEIPLF